MWQCREADTQRFGSCPTTPRRWLQEISRRYYTTRRKGQRRSMKRRARQMKKMERMARTMRVKWKRMGKLAGGPDEELTNKKQPDFDPRQRRLTGNYI